MKTKRILAAIALLFMLACILIMVVSAFSNSPNSQYYLIASLFCLTAIPVGAYGYLIIIRHGKHKEK